MSGLGGERKLKLFSFLPFSLLFYSPVRRISFSSMNFSPLPFLIAFVIALTIFSFIRILSLLPPVRRKLGWPAYRYESKEASSQRKCKVAVMLGSGELEMKT